MCKMKVWTKQHKNILDTLEQNGRHIAKREHIVGKMENISKFYLDVYNWYVRGASKFVQKPEDVEYPIWVSLTPESALSNDPDTIVLELELDSSKVLELDFDQWGYIVNYMYIAEGPEDECEHQKLLDKYGINDPQAYMTNYYPAIKKKIIKSWDRIFQSSNLEEKTIRVGTIWEIKKEWIKKIIR